MIPALEPIVATCRNDPAFAQAMDQLRRATVDGQRFLLPSLTPRRVRGDQLVSAVALCTTGYSFSPSSPVATDLLATWGNEQTRKYLATATRDAVPFLWMRDLMMLADSMPLPRHVVGSDLFPHDVMYWTLDSDITIVNPSSGYHNVTVQAWLIIRVPSGYLLGAFTEAERFETGRRIGALIVDLVPMGARYPDDIRGGLAPTLLKMAAFLNSPFVSVRRETDRPSRKARRRYGPRVGDPVVLNIVTLRAEVREAVRVERGEGPKWKQRWLVRGHYRAQWYPASQSHKVIWVAPYIKGPDDAPLKMPVYAVVR